MGVPTMKMLSAYFNRVTKTSFESARKDKKVVFTNGCFDILHYGHLHLLNQAKQLGDILVVGLNSDSSITQLKGPSRPILNEQKRRITLSLLPMVDFIFIFEERTPYSLIKTIEPDFLVKGKDWEGKIVGEDWIKARGGDVAIIELIEGISTTDIIERCHKSFISL